MNKLDAYDKIIIIGAGGHARTIADIIISDERFKDKEIAFLDDNLAAGTKIFNLPVIGKVKDCIKHSGARFIIAIGNNDIRKSIVETYNLEYLTVIHKTAVLGTDTEIKQGTVIMANAVVNPSAKVGKHCIINTGAVVEHDNIIHDYVHISPGACLGGTVSIGQSSHIGIGATVKNNVNIAGNCIIGAGAVVIKDINEEGTYVGIPAVRLKKGRFE